MIMTSYFAKYKGNKACSIAITEPEGFKGVKCSQLMPPKSLLVWYKHNMEQIQYLDKEDTIEEFIQARKKIQNQYIESYHEEVLSKLDPASVAANLDGYVLLCWEKSGSFCHRYVVSQWLNEHGYKCREFVTTGTLKTGGSR